MLRHHPFDSGANVLAVALLTTAVAAVWNGGSAAAQGVPPPTVSRDPIAPSPVRPPVTYRPGWYLGTQALVTYLHQDTAQGPDPTVHIGDPGVGMRLLGGYAFTEGFALELSVLAAGFETDHPGTDAALVQMELDAVAHLRAGRRLQPYVAGGIGGVAVGVEGDAVPRQTVGGGQVDVGGGLEFHVARHFGLSVDYRYAVHHLQRRTIDLGGVETRIDIDAQGHANTWGLRCVYSF